MDGRDFEILVKSLLEGNGYEIPKITKASGDQGVDIITYKDGKKIAVQCKRYSSKIPNTAVQEVYSGKNYYDCQEAYVITNSYFTPSAVELARKNQVKLIDRQDLFHMMESAKGKIDESYMAYQTEINFES